MTLSFIQITAFLWILSGCYQHLISDFFGGIQRHFDSMPKSYDSLFTPFSVKIEGVAVMCKVMEDMRNEAAHEAAHKAERESARKTAKRFLKMGKLSHEEISDGTGLPLEEVKALEEEIMHLV